MLNARSTTELCPQPHTFFSVRTGASLISLQAISYYHIIFFSLSRRSSHYSKIRIKVKSLPINPQHVTHNKTSPCLDCSPRLMIEEVYHGLFEVMKVTQNIFLNYQLPHSRRVHLVFNSIFSSPIPKSIPQRCPQAEPRQELIYSHGKVGKFPMMPQLAICLNC